MILTKTTKCGGGETQIGIGISRPLFKELCRFRVTTRKVLKVLRTKRGESDKKGNSSRIKPQ